MDGLRVPTTLLNRRGKGVEGGGGGGDGGDVGGSGAVADEVDEDSEEKIEGFVEMMSGKKAWRRVWLRIQGPMLFQFGAPKDKSPAFQTMLLGASWTESEVRGAADEDLVQFSLRQVNQHTGTESAALTFRAKFGADADRWREALAKNTGQE